MKMTTKLMLLAALPLCLTPYGSYSAAQSDSVEFDKAPVAISQVQPKYPEAAMKDHIEGTVFLKVLVDRQGAVRDVTVLKTDSKVLEQAAIDAMRQWRFTPASLQEEPVDAWITVPFRFKMKDDMSMSAVPSDSVEFDTAPVAVSH